jgi:2'-5' RNA ligase
VTVRAFIALNLPKRERDRVYRAVEPLREGGLPVRWIHADSLHVTLKFLGSVKAEKIGAVTGRLEEVAASTAPFHLSLGGFGAFPTIRRPSVLWLGVHASPELRCLKQDLEWALTECGFEAETRAFHPHLSLGRANTSRGAGAFRGLDDALAGMDFKKDVPMQTVELMQSRLSRDGATYTVLASAKLAGGS